MNPKLKLDIEIELDNMTIVVNEAISLIKIIDKNIPDNIQKTALAAFVSQFYNGAENILKRITKDCDIPLPIGDNWHLQLLQRYAPTSDFYLPFKFNQELYDNLNDLRRFRHYFFHGYSINIDWTILKESLLGFDELFNSFKESLKDILTE
jgi:hypothetical protein